MESSMFEPFEHITKVKEEKDDSPSSLGLKFIGKAIATIVSGVFFYGLFTSSGGETGAGWFFLSMWVIW